MKDFYTQLKHILESESIQIQNIPPTPTSLSEKQHLQVFGSLFKALAIKKKKLKSITKGIKISKEK